MASLKLRRPRRTHREASVATNVEAFEPSVLFWRSFTHLIGGMGVLVFVLGLFCLPLLPPVQIAKAETPDRPLKITPVFGYCAHSLFPGSISVATRDIHRVLLLLGGNAAFDAVCHAFWYR